MPSVAIRGAVSLFGFTRLELLLCVLLVVFQCVVLAGKPVQTRPTERPRVANKEADVFGVSVEFNVSGRAPKICRHCRRDFFRPDGTDRRICNRCQPCTVCAYDERITAPCTPIQDTKCTPLCEDDFYLNRATRTCQRKVDIKHQLIFEEVTDTSTIRSKTEITVLTDRTTNQPSGDLKTFGRANQGSHSSSRVVEAESEEESPAYMTSLFASGAAGVAVLVLLVFVSVYVALRIKQWWNYKMSLQDRDSCHCILLPCCVHCKHGHSQGSSYVETGYPTTGNRSSRPHGRQQRRTPIGIKVTRVKASVKSSSTLEMNSKECQEGSMDELQKNRQTELSQTNGIENTARASYGAAVSPGCDKFDMPNFAGVETVM